MPDEPSTTPVDGQAPPAAEGQEPNGTPPQEGTPPAGQEPPGESTETKRLRGEAAKYRTELREAQERLKAIEDAALSEEQRREQALATATAERDELTKRAAAATLRADVVIAASRLGIVDPDAAYRLLDPVDPNADDYEQQLEAALEQLVVKRPYLKAAAAGDPPKDPPSIPPTNGAKPPGSTELTSEDLNKMDRHQIAALPREVVAAAMKR